MPPVEGTETGERVTPSSPNVLLLLAFGSSRCFPWQARPNNQYRSLDSIQNLPTMEKSKKAKTAHQVLMPQLFAPMGIGKGMGMAPATVTAPAKENHGESQSSESQAFERKGKTPDSGEKMLSASTMYRLPPKHLRQVVYGIVPEFATLITEFDQEMLTRILYSLSGLKPQTRCKSFEALEILIRH